MMKPGVPDALYGIGKPMLKQIQAQAILAGTAIGRPDLDLLKTHLVEDAPGQPIAAIGALFRV